MPPSSNPQVHFSSLENSFFQAGDELSTRPDDEFEEPVCAMRGHGRWVGSWPIAAATVGVSCVAGLALFGRAHTEPAPRLPDSTVATLASVRPAPAGPQIAHRPAGTKPTAPVQAVAVLASAPLYAVAVTVPRPGFIALTDDRRGQHGRALLHRFAHQCRLPSAMPLEWCKPETDQ